MADFYGSGIHKKQFTPVRKLSSSTSSLSDIRSPIKKPTRRRHRPNTFIDSNASIISFTHRGSGSSKSHSTPTKAGRAIGSIHRSLQRLLNVHPEKFRSHNQHQLYSRSVSPQLMPANHEVRSKSIDLSTAMTDRSKTVSPGPSTRTLLIPNGISTIPKRSGSLASVLSPVPIVHVPPTPSLSHNSRQLSYNIDLGLLDDNVEDLFTDDEEKIPNEIITINVSGMRFQTRERTLLRFPETVLGNPFKRRRYYNVVTGEYFFDRHRTCFESILHIYQSEGQVMRPETIPLDLFLEELRFFQFSDEIHQKFWASEGYKKPVEPVLPSNRKQRLCWQFLEYPESSIPAKIFAWFSIITIVISIASLCLETIQGLKPYGEVFNTLELLCSVWFLIELVTRFIFCPEKGSFCKNLLNILDLFAVAPFFFSLVFNVTSAMPFSVFRIIRLIRVFRIFKLGRHSVGLRVLGKTFAASKDEFALLIFFLGIALVLFSSGVYFAEQGEPDTKFTSIPAAFWFVLATLSTVGYGDLVPTGPYGKIVGGFCSLIGVVTIALPVPIIVANFKRFYRQESRLAQMYATAQLDNLSNISNKSFDAG